MTAPTTCAMLKITLDQRAPSRHDNAVLVTVYDGKTQLLIKNPIERYLINTPMPPRLKKNADGSLTHFIQKKSTGKRTGLPAPAGLIFDRFAMEVRYRFTLTAVRPCSAMKLVIQFLGSHGAALCAAPSPPDRSRLALIIKPPVRNRSRNRFMTSSVGA